MLRFLLLDNYDSFTYNLEHYLSALNVDVEVVRNDSQVDLSGYDAIILSPGPGLPKDAGVLMEVIEQSIGKVPILGVCLGMQAGAEFLGGSMYNQNKVKHGVSEKVSLGSSVLFSELPEEINVGLYHSWAIRKDEGEFEVTAISEEGVVMAIENVSKLFYGVQFHPESVMTDFGLEMMKNFVEFVSNNQAHK